MMTDLVNAVRELDRVLLCLVLIGVVVGVALARAAAVIRLRRDGDQVVILGRAERVRCTLASTLGRIVFDVDGLTGSTTVCSALRAPAQGSIVLVRGRKESDLEGEPFVVCERCTGV